MDWAIAFCIAIVGFPIACAVGIIAVLIALRIIFD